MVHVDRQQRIVPAPVAGVAVARAVAQVDLRLREQLVDLDAVEPCQALEPGHGQDAVAALVGAQHRPLELLTRFLVHRLEGQPSAASHFPKAPADRAGKADVIARIHVVFRQHPFDTLSELSAGRGIRGPSGIRGGKPQE